jgi:hypothetical protein
MPHEHASLYNFEKKLADDDRPFIVLTETKPIHWASQS